MFMLPNYQPTAPPPYLQTFFTETGRLIVDIISMIMGFNTNEYVDDITLVFLSIFTPGQPPTVKYDYATFNANKIHDQFMSLDREEFSNTHFLYTIFCYIISQTTFLSLSGNWTQKEIKGF